MTVRISTPFPWSSDHPDHIEPGDNGHRLNTGEVVGRSPAQKYTRKTPYRCGVCDGWFFGFGIGCYFCPATTAGPRCQMWSEEQINPNGPPCCHHVEEPAPTPEGAAPKQDWWPVLPTPTSKWEKCRHPGCDEARQRVINAGRPTQGESE